MAKKKTTSKKEEEPVISVVDRRSAMLEEDEQATFQEERLPSYVERLKQEAQEKDQKLKDYVAAYKEKTAEDDGFRKRLEKDNDVRLDQFKANLFSRLVPILDNLNRALQAVNSNRDFDGLNQGVEMVSKQFSRELKNNDVEVIDTKNRKFNSKTDEIFLTEETDDPKMENMIVQELEPGYIFKDKLIKAAKVKVAHLKT
ncbi:MAG TPA: nucleotide exchange factor GrpE [Nitrospinae bacterium]|jgi:molecular chaperone GrpE|nr:nucleotide exchange factor GrpE [Nitrospinota bacterium]